MECFTVYADGIEGRIDPLYLKNKTIIEEPKTKFALVKLGRLLKSKVQYGANEIAIDGKPRQDIRYIRITDIDEFGNLRSDEWKTAQNIEEKYLLNEGDILFARSGATAGKCFLYKKEYGKSIFAGYLIRFIFDTSKVNPKYIFYYTQLERYKLWVKSIQRPSGQPNINSEEFKSLKIPLLPIQTQNRIAQLMGNAYEIKKQKKTEAQQLIDSINGYILDELNIKVPELKDERCYVIWGDDVESDRIDPRYYKPLFTEFEKELAKRNDIKTIEEISDYIGSGATPRAGGSDYTTEDEGIPFIRIVNVKNNTIVLDDVLYIKPEIHQGMLRRTQLKPNDVLLSMAGTIGLSVVVPENFGEVNINQALARIMLKEGYNPYYISSILNSQIGKIQTDRLSRPAVQANINLEEIRALKTPIPPLQIQNKIAEEVKQRMQKAEQLQKEAKEVLEEAKERAERIILGDEEI